MAPSAQQHLTQTEAARVSAWEGASLQTLQGPAESLQPLPSRCQASACSDEGLQCMCIMTLRSMGQMHVNRKQRTC